MNRHIPGSPEILHRLSIPPVLVELPVGEPHHLGNGVADGVEGQIEADQPHAVIGNLQPHGITHSTTSVPYHHSGALNVLVSHLLAANLN